MLKRFLLIALLSGAASATAQEPDDDKTDRAVAKESHKFAVRMNQRIDLLVNNYYRPLDENELAVEALRGLLKSTGKKYPKEIDDRLVQAVAPKKERTFEEQLNDALDKLDQLDGKGQRLKLLEDARRSLGDLKLHDGQDYGMATNYIIIKLDRKTALLWPDEAQKQAVGERPAKAGELGFTYTRPAKDGPPVIASIWKDGPAHRAGLRAGDVITRFDVWLDWRFLPVDKAQPYPTPAISDWGLVRMRDGLIDEKVHLYLQRDRKPFETTLVRSAVKRETLAGLERRDDNSWNHMLDGDIAYARLLNTAFPDSVKDLDDLLASFETQSLKGLILDLRFAGAGNATIAASIADLFVDDVPIVDIRGQKDVPGPRKGTKGSRLPRVPIACLINAETGLGGEIIASCLQDQRRAAIIGERTAGEGGVINYFPLDGGFFLRITTAHCFRPDGRPLDKLFAQTGKPPAKGAPKSDDWGVTPDLAIPLPPDERDTLRRHLTRQTLLKEDLAPPTAAPDRQRDRAVEYLRAKSK